MRVVGDAGRGCMAKELGDRFNASRVCAELAQVLASDAPTRPPSQSTVEVVQPSQPIKRPASLRGDPRMISSSKEQLARAKKLLGLDAHLDDDY